MTDDELKQLVASLAIAQQRTEEHLNQSIDAINASFEKRDKEFDKITEEFKCIIEQSKLLSLEMEQMAEQFKRTDEQFKRTDEQFRRTDEQIKRSDEQFKRTDEQLKRSDEQFKRTDEQLRRTDEQFKRTDEQLRRTDEQLKRTDEKLERMGIHLGNITRNQGEVAEEFFFNSLAQNNHLGSIYFDDITQNMKKHRGQIQEEYDLVMTNGDVIGIVEVKYKAHENDLEKLERKIKNFKQLFPVYKNYQLYGAIASFHINDDAKNEALKRGYFVLQRRGDVIHAENGEQLAVF